MKNMDSDTTTTTKEIKFRCDDGDCFLSNFYLTPIMYGGRTYQSAEHLYQAATCVERIDRDKIRETTSPRSVKILARFLKKRPEWDNEKLIRTMFKTLKLKFRKAWLKKLLQATGDAKLVHLNYWHDTFYGVCICTQHKRTGKNWLGVLLMKLRDEFK